MKKHFIKVSGSLLFLSTMSFAQTQKSDKVTDFSNWNSGSVLLVFALIILLISIYLLSKTAISLGKAIAANPKIKFILIPLLLSGLLGKAQDLPNTEVKSDGLPGWVFHTESYLLIFVTIIMLLTVYVLYSVNMKLIHVLHPTTDLSEENESAMVKVTQVSWLRKLYLRMVDSVPVQQEKDILLDHDYDGIKELDNNLPPWWKAGFYVTIIFAIVYMFHFHVFGSGKLQKQEYADEIRVAEQQRAERLKAAGENVNEGNVVLLADAESVTKGKESFEKLCTACHRADAGGQVGPNLTDEYWLHGGGIKNIFKTITYGVPDKGMISWKTQLSPKQIQQVASYVVSLQGSHPAGAKEQQGEIWTEEKPVAIDSAVVKADSTESMKGIVSMK